MFKINRNSWHYNLQYKFFNSGPGETLCSYFWKTIFATISIGFLFFTLTPLILLIASIAVFTIAIPFFVQEFDSNIISIMVIGTFIWIITITETFKELNRKYKWTSNLFNKQKTKKKKHQQSSMIVEYLKAKKDKVCPLIEFVDKQEKT